VGEKWTVHMHPLMQYAWFMLICVVLDWLTSRPAGPFGVNAMALVSRNWAGLVCEIKADPMTFWNVTQNKSLGDDLLQCHTKQVVARRLVAMSHKTSRRATTCCNVTQNKSSGDDLLQFHTKQVVAQELIAMSPKKKVIG